MVKAQPEFGETILSDVLDTLDDYIVVTMDEPWELLKSKLKTKPREVIFNRDMQMATLEKIEKKQLKAKWIVGFGGGTACDTGKYLSWKWNIPLIISPSIISVDAWLCTSIAVRIDHKVRYIGDVQPARVLVDYSIVKQAPKALNRTGVSDTISITTALGDWLIARDSFGDKFDQAVFDEAKHVAETLMKAAKDIKDVSNKGIDALVKGYVDEVKICEAWGNARPEEGGEHFLAYCLEEITHGHYLHGNLIGLNILVVLKLQKEKAVFKVEQLKQFFDDIGIEYAPGENGITRDQYQQALESVQAYVRREKLLNGLWSLPRVFDDEGPCSIQGILDWIYSF
ncbi:MAG: iron-containing alcohol dehydrogenase [Candidatus Lokiarchaeota archaeon]|nr:iron-containing alcohol dehydrogenase [Candidatus Lokiarchaeota archaeon]